MRACWTCPRGARFRAHLHDAGFPDAPSVGLAAALSRCGCLPLKVLGAQAGGRAPGERRGTRPGSSVARPAPLGTRGRRRAASPASRWSVGTEGRAALRPARVRAVGEPPARAAFSRAVSGGGRDSRLPPLHRRLRGLSGWGGLLLPPPQRPVGERVTRADPVTGLPPPGCILASCQHLALPRRGGGGECPRKLGGGRSPPCPPCSRDSGCSPGEIPGAGAAAAASEGEIDQ